MPETNYRLIDNNKVCAHVFEADGLQYMFGWFRKKEQIVLYIKRLLEKKNDTKDVLYKETSETIYDWEEDDCIHPKWSNPMKIAYFEGTMENYLGPNYNVGIDMGYALHLKSLDSTLKSEGIMLKKTKGGHKESKDDFDPMPN
jgi:hypothetical protein